MTLNVSLGFSKTSSGGEGPISGITVHRFQLRDALSELFELSITLASTDPAVDMHAVVGEGVVVTFHDEPTEGQGTVEGIVRSVRQLTSAVVSTTTAGASTYEVVIVPPLWLTTRRRNHRIFEKKSAVDIVTEILADYGSKIPAPSKRIRKDPQVREYVVQYGETDYEFISRVLAADFLTSYFDHQNHGAYTLIDDTVQMTSGPGEAVPFLPPSNLTTPPPHVLNVVVASSIETSQARVRDYNYENSPNDLEGQDSKAPDGGHFKNEADLEAYMFEIGEFTDKGAGDERAKHHLEALRARARTYTLQANFTVGPGRRMKLGGHPRSDANDDFLVIRTRIICDDGAERGITPTPRPTAEFFLEGIKASVPFLPSPRPKPKIHGTQTGVVVNKDGDVDGDKGNVVADSMSRVKVRFQWQKQTDKSKKTRPVRVSQAWAGTKFGFFVMPRVGDEVVIAYLDGDPDEPLIVGRVHNSPKVNPINPEGAEKTISTWRSQTIGNPSGFNEVLMDDLLDKERLELHAQKDYKRTVEHDSTLIVKHDETLTVGGNKSDKINKAYSMSAGSVSISCGPYTLGASEIKETAKTTFVMEAGDQILLKVGGSSITLEPGGITIEAPKITIHANGVVDIDGSLIELN
jgi:type VI secretion system secreted protein VgrG